jgi:hypothetical protein
MLLGPRHDSASQPDPPGAQLCLGFREVLGRLDDGVDALPGHPEHLRDLRHADQVVHSATVLLTTDNPER